MYKRQVLSYKKPAFWLVLLAVVVCVGAAVCFLTDPKDCLLYTSLPANLKVIGKDTFKDNFREGTELKVHIPESVEIIGSQAFYNEKFAQIYIDRQSGYKGYDLSLIHI